MAGERAKRSVLVLLPMVALAAVAWSLLPQQAAPTAEKEVASPAAVALAAPAEAANPIASSERERASPGDGDLAQRAQPEQPTIRDAVVAALVLVDGNPAPAGLAWRLSTGGDDPGSEPAVAMTDGRGRFVFGGLPRTWRGTLLPPPTHWLLPRDGEAWEPSWLVLPGPADDLVLPTVALPSITGRVVFDDDGAPVAGVQVSVAGDFAGDVTAAGNTVTAADGTFAIGLEPNPNRYAAWIDGGSRAKLLAVRVFCGRGPGTVAGAERQVEAVDGNVPPIELRLPRARRQHFVATDHAGAKIAGARVNVELSAASDAEGLGWFEGAPSLIGAPGYAVVPAKPQGGDGSQQQPLQFVLPKANTLRVVVHRVDGEAARGLQVVLESAERLRAGRQRSSELHAEFGGTRVMSSGSRRLVLPSGAVEQRETLDLPLDGDGTAVLHSLEPDLAGEVVIADSLDVELARAAFRTPPFGAEAVVEVEIASEPRLVRGVVFGRGGAPLARAEVRLHGAGGSEWEHTDADGRFQFAAVHTDEPLTLVVLAPGHVKDVREGLVRATDEEHVFRLVPGATVTVHVVDAEGAPVPVFAQPAGFEELENQTLDTGVYRWSDLPPFVEFYAEIQGQRFAVPHDTARAEARLQVPAVAQVHVPSAALPRGLEGKPHDYAVELRHLGEPSLDVVRLRVSDLPGAFVSVLPGRYAATVVRKVRTADGLDHVPVGVQTTVELKAGDTTPLSFD